MLKISGVKGSQLAALTAINAKRDRRNRRAVANAVNTATAPAVWSRASASFGATSARETEIPLSFKLRHISNQLAAPTAATKMRLVVNIAP